MVKELPGTRNASNDTNKPPKWHAVRLILAFLHVMGLAMVAQYVLSAKGNRGSITNVLARNKQDNRAVAILPVHNTSTAEDDHYPSTNNPESEQEKAGVLDGEQGHEMIQLQDGQKFARDHQVSYPIDRIPTPLQTQNMSVLTYRACCGLGHRLGRQSAAYHAAHKLGFKLEVEWPGCNGINVFDELFFPETLEDLTYANSTHEFYKVSNEVPGYHNADRNCLPEELESNYDMYFSLKQRFKQKDNIDSFIQQHFQGHFAIGIHVRAGNGAQGDFSSKRRQVGVPPQQYAQRVSKNIVDLLRRSNITDPPVLFVATDTAGFVQAFQMELEGVMPVVEWKQEHLAEGEGVFMGQGQKQLGQNECVQKWKDMLYDMILLASTDLLIAGQYSSFSQAMPMALVLGEDPIAGTDHDSFCEVYQDGLRFVCYSNKMDWCMKTQQMNSLKTLNVRGGQWPHFLNKMYASSKYQKRSD